MPMKDSFTIVIVFLIIVGILAIGGLCFDYCLRSIFGKDIPFIGDVIAGFVTCELAVPLAVVCGVLRFFGWNAPFFKDVQ